MAFTRLHIIFFILIILTLTAAKQLRNNNKRHKKCRALALEGGGQKGAYQAGAIKALVEHLPPEESQWDVISGISVGAINGFGISLFEKGSEKEMSEFLLNIWDRMTADRIYKSWNWGFVESFIDKPSLYDNSPLKDFLRETASNKTIKRKITIGAVDANTGEFQNFNETLSVPDFIEAVIASAAMPAIFPFHVINGSAYIDGGSMLGIDIPAAINRCKNMGFDDEDIIVDAIFCAPSGLTQAKVEKYNALQMFFRYWHVSNYEMIMGSLCMAHHDYPAVDFRYFISPSQKLSGLIKILSFDKDEIRNMINLGFKDATIAVEKGGDQLKSIVDKHLNVETDDEEEIYRSYNMRMFKKFN